MTILLWIDAIIASIGVGALILAFFGRSSGYAADDRMATDFFAVIGAGLLGVAIVFFILLTAIKAWS